MKIDILASGSSGNCIALTVDDNTILIDAGIAKTKIEKALLTVDIRPDDVQAIFITHAHNDHTKGLPIANKYKIPVYATEGEWKNIKNVESKNRKVLFESIEIDTDYFAIFPFPVHHDAYSPVGFSITDIDSQDKCSICLDTGHVDERMMIAMAESDIYIMEANHEPGMVERSDYPNSVKTRILSDIGHLSNEQTAAALATLVQGKGERIYLVHLSDKNNISMLAEVKINTALQKEGFQHGKDYTLEVM